MISTALCAKFGCGRAGGDGDIGKKTEAHAPVGQGMMAGRPHQRHGIVRLACHHRLGQIDQRARRCQRRRRRSRAQHRCRDRDGPRPGAIDSGHQFDIGGRMHPHAAVPAQMGVTAAGLQAIENAILRAATTWSWRAVPCVRDGRAWYVVVRWGRRRTRSSWAQSYLNCQPLNCQL